MSAPNTEKMEALRTKLTMDKEKAHIAYMQKLAIKKAEKRTRQAELRKLHNTAAATAKTKSLVPKSAAAKRSVQKSATSKGVVQTKDREKAHIAYMQKLTNRKADKRTKQVRQ